MHCVGLQLVLIKLTRQLSNLKKFRPCLVEYLSNMFLVFKQHYTHFHTFFHTHVFQKNTSNITQTPLPNGPLILKRFNTN